MVHTVHAQGQMRKTGRPEGSPPYTVQSADQAEPVNAFHIESLQRESQRPWEVWGCGENKSSLVSTPSL